jgi:hypothetical protein
MMPQDEYISEQEWNGYSPLEQIEYVHLLEKRSWELSRILKAVLCPEHGECIPYLMEQLEAHGITPPAEPQPPADCLQQLS